MRNVYSIQHMSKPWIYIHCLVYYYHFPAKYKCLNPRLIVLGLNLFGSPSFLVLIEHFTRPILNLKISCMLGNNVHRAHHFTSAVRIEIPVHITLCLLNFTNHANAQELSHKGLLDVCSISSWLFHLLNYLQTFSFQIWLTLSSAIMNKLKFWVLVEFLWDAPCKLTPVLQPDLSVLWLFLFHHDWFLYKALVKDYIRNFENWSGLYWADLLYKPNNW